MRTRRSLQFALAAVAALLAAGTTFAWAGVLVGGHRADRIGTFEPVAHRLVPAGEPIPSATVTSQPKTTTASPAPTVALTPSYSLAPTSPSEPTSAPASASTRHDNHSDDSTPPTTDNNGRNHDD